MARTWVRGRRLAGLQLAVLDDLQAAGAPRDGAPVAPMTLLEGQENEVELEKSNVLLLGPTGGARCAGPPQSARGEGFWVLLLRRLQGARGLPDAQGRG